MPRLRRKLTGEEKERRQKVLAAVDETRLRPGWGPREALRHLQEGVTKRNIQAGALPFSSAAHFNFYVDKVFWERFCKKDSQFPFVPDYQRKADVPYSAQYAKAYFAARPTPEQRKIRANKGAREKEKRRNPQLIRGRAYKQALEDMVASQVYLSQKSSQGRHECRAPWGAKVELHKALLGKAMPYLPGCGPFEMECPFSAFGQEFAVCFGSMGVLSDVLREASLYMGGDNLQILLYAKFRDLANGDRRISLLLEWHHMVNETSPAWRRGFYKAWCALLSLLNRQLQGARVSLTGHLRQYYGQQAAEHLALHSQIDRRMAALESQEEARRQMVEGMKGEGISEDLVQEMERFTREIGGMRVEMHIGSKENVAEKVEQLVYLSADHEGLFSLAPDAAARQGMIRPTAEKVFTEVVRSLTHDPKIALSHRLEGCEVLLGGSESPWGKLLPRDVRYNIMSAALWDYQRDHGQAGEFEIVGRGLKTLELVALQDQVWSNDQGLM
ncbi:hypothetical protein F5X98DRAFT_283112 [Xylaria grammica]|nr:hypothetical protein F5X98DRAFT_283112 [Xylaria grammica]